MSTTTPIKFKKVSANWETIKGSYHEAPTSFDFSKESNIRAKNKKGYDKHYIYTDESGNTCFVVERKKKDDDGMTEEQMLELQKKLFAQAKAKQAF